MPGDLETDLLPALAAALFEAHITAGMCRGKAWIQHPGPQKTLLDFAKPMDLEPRDSIFPFEVTSETVPADRDGSV